ncbi:MAG: acetyltransferase [Cyanobacteria bacterium REEB65]|nr:acetyltransferase [Cyanobacteria bacterium REEB65]
MRPSSPGNAWIQAGRAAIVPIALLSLLAGCGSSAGAGLNGGSAPGAFAAQGVTAQGQNYVVDRTVSGGGWARIERLSSTLPNFPVEHSRPNGHQVEPEILDGFGSPFPPSSEALLQYMPGWDTGSGSVVLLVHGSCMDADSDWLDPFGRTGLAPTLAGEGFRVFAITFAHRNGDNLLQGQLLADAIDRVRQVTGVAQIDMVAHSKGGIVARALLSHMVEPGMPDYPGGVHRLVLVGTPNMGVDYTYRHPIIDYGLYPEKDDYHVNVPLPWDKMLFMGLWVDTSDLTMSKAAGNYFPGLEQLLYRWDGTYPLDMTEPDWYSTYYGGQGFVSASEGIDQAISESGDFMAKLKEHPLDPSVQVAVIGGDKADLANIFNENTGPSDGIIFVKSAMATEDMTRGGAKLIASKVLHLNHFDLVSLPAGMSAISAQLTN